MTNIIYRQESYAIIGAAMKVHNELGCGFLESVYQEAFEVELKHRNIPYLREAPLSINYRGAKLNKEFRVDFICYDKVIVELKAVREFISIHEAQVLNYLKVSGISLGLLINFGNIELETKRFVK
ncbi:GxxExxY protein [Labilibacter marinus]|uniref:GxxExxY protein n=1 Tax=Labilibacter marinus TaxID=1477105 RepID=UPI000830238A|nr:GxxExxY protein [Labilibacter marinus]